jgi:hypothetical protein
MPDYRAAGPFFQAFPVYRPPPYSSFPVAHGAAQLELL